MHRQISVFPPSLLIMRIAVHRAIGFGDYHFNMRGVGRKWKNFTRLIEKKKQMKNAPDSVRFEESLLTTEAAPSDV